MHPAFRDERASLHIAQSLRAGVRDALLALGRDDVASMIPR